MFAHSFSEELPESVSCYKLKNGSKMYLRHKYPFDIYSDSACNFSNKIPPELPVRFAGEMNDSLYFYTKRGSREEGVKAYEYVFYKALCATPLYGSMLIETLEVGNELIMDYDISFAVQQPYFLKFADAGAIFQSFDGEQVELNRGNFELLRTIKSYTFFIWRGTIIIVRRNIDSNITSISPELFNQPFRLIDVEPDLPLPNSIYDHERLLYMLCGIKLFSIHDNFMYFHTYEIDHNNCQIAGAKNRKLYFNAPCVTGQSPLFYSRHFHEDCFEVGKPMTHEDEIQLKLQQQADEISHYKEEKKRLLKSIHDLQLLRHSGRFDKEFTITKTLGRGSYGVVFEVVNKWDKKEYAVKQIPVNPTPFKLDEALTEARAMAELSHEAIVNYNSTWIEKPPDVDKVFLYIQMQLCKYPLDQWLSENRTTKSRSLERMKFFFKQIVSGVNHMHSKKLIHRDLKPPNILFVEDTRLKIADMGIVIERKMVDGKEIAITHNGSGTGLYMSPEQACSFVDLEAKSDVFTLGLIFVELCIFMNMDKKVEVFNKYRYGKPDPIFGDDHTTTSFVTALTHCNSTNRPSCQEILDDLYINRLE